MSVLRLGTPRSPVEPWNRFVRADDPGARRREAGLKESASLQLAGLDTTGWTFEEVVDVSADRKSFVGYGTREGSDDYLFYAVIPEPTAALLLGMGLMGLRYAGAGRGRGRG